MNNHCMCYVNTTCKALWWLWPQKRCNFHQFLLKSWMWMPEKMFSMHFYFPICHTNELRQHFHGTYSSPPSPCWQCHISELLLVIHTCQNRLTMKGGALCCTENQINPELTNLLFLRPFTEVVLFSQFQISNK